MRLFVKKILVKFCTGVPIKKQRENVEKKVKNVLEIYPKRRSHFIFCNFNHISNTVYVFRKIFFYHFPFIN